MGKTTVIPNLGTVYACKLVGVKYRVGSQQIGDVLCVVCNIILEKRVAYRVSVCIIHRKLLKLVCEAGLVITPASVYKSCRIGFAVYCCGNFASVASFHLKGYAVRSVSSCKNCIVSLVYLIDPYRPDLDIPEDLFVGYGSIVKSLILCRVCGLSVVAEACSCPGQVFLSAVDNIHRTGIRCLLLSQACPLCGKGSVTVIRNCQIICVFLSYICSVGKDLQRGL